MKAIGPGLEVRGFGFRGLGSGFGVQGLGFRLQGLGLRVLGSGFGVQGSEFGVQGSGEGVLCLAGVDSELPHLTVHPVGPAHPPPLWVCNSVGNSDAVGNSDVW